MTDSNLEMLKAVIVATIRETVNGKIDRLSEKVDRRTGEIEQKLDEHVDRVEPLIAVFSFVKSRAFKIGGSLLGVLLGADIVTRILG